MDCNPLTRLDYPDPDVIRVGDTYYMVSTTMHFMPGCGILRSYDLKNWEHAAYVYETLDGTPGQKLQDGRGIYGKGMWAASLRYRKNGDAPGGTFYVCFSANDTRKTYLYTARDIQGPWEKKKIEGFYHDGSLLFDDDGSVYIAYGNRDIYITQLKEDLSGPLEGGLHRLAVSDADNPNLGYEGTHFYKIGGRYYLFFIHSRRDRWRRVESCFMADSLQGAFTGGDVLDDDRGYCGQGVAQGGVVDTPDGKWYAVLFQDSGAVGRIPVLVPVTWKGARPVFGENGRIPEQFPVRSTRPGYRYRPLVESDDFRGPLKACWQFNHEPDWRLIGHTEGQGVWKVTTGTVCRELTQAVNTITQRMMYPGCSAEVTVDGAGLGEGDYAGLCALQGSYGMIALTRREGKLYLAMFTAASREAPGAAGEKDGSAEGRSAGREGPAWREWAAVPAPEERVRLRLEVDFTYMRDTASFYYWEKEAGENSLETGGPEGSGARGRGQKAGGPAAESALGRWEKLGPDHKLYFGLDHFTGCRFGLAVCSTAQAGGSGAFREFQYLER